MEKLPRARVNYPHLPTVEVGAFFLELQHYIITRLTTYSSSIPLAPRVLLFAIL